MNSYFLIGMLFMMTLDMISINKGLPNIGFLGRFFIVIIWPIALLIFLKSLLDSQD